MAQLFSDRLIDAIRERHCSLCVGLDPTIELMPPVLMNECISAYGESLDAVAVAFERFNRAIIDAVFDIVPAVKPQMAFYEAVGLPGAKAFLQTVRYAQSKGLIVIEDAKRNDIGSTAAAYATGHLGRLQIGSRLEDVYGVDAITVNPYLGTDGISPFVVECQARGKGIFVLAKTSNPSSGQIQDLLLADDRGSHVSGVVAGYIEEWGKSLVGENGYSSVGAVVGATFPEQAARLRRIMPHAIFLVPGLGAQGGTAKDVVPCFDRSGTGALVSSSRGIIGAWKKRLGAEAAVESPGFRDAIRQATLEARDELNDALTSMQDRRR